MEGAGGHRVQAQVELVRPAASAEEGEHTRGEHRRRGAQEGPARFT